jgi:predicted nucleic acid-binding protein
VSKRIDERLAEAYLVDTDVISEMRKGSKANVGVRSFFRDAAKDGAALYLSVITIGELRRGVEVIRHRGDLPQALRLSRWLARITSDYADSILSFDAEIAEVWGLPQQRSCMTSPW